MTEMRGKIKSFSPNGEYTNRYGQLISKFLITFADDRQYTFGFKSPDFKFNIGDEIEYEVKDEKYKNAAIVYEKPSNFNKPSNMKSMNFDTNRSILRQVAFKGAIELACNGKIQMDQIKATTEYFYDKVLNV